MILARAAHTLRSMKSRANDPRRLDVEALARDGANLDGIEPVDRLPRVVSSLLDAASAAETDAVAWQARGELRKPKSPQPEPWLHLDAQASLPLQCQRCLAAVWTPIAVHRAFKFVRGEDVAAELDAEEEEDVLALPRWLDLIELLEDELLLALPLVPRHDICPVPLNAPVAEGETSEPEARAHPFASLAALKRKS